MPPDGPVRLPERDRDPRDAASTHRRPPRFRDYTEEVCLAIRQIQSCRTDAERPLSALERRALAHAIDVIAEHGDMQAQVDAAGLS